MTDAAEKALAFLEALKRLPPFAGIVFHGLPTVPDLTSARWTRGVTATSRDPRIATENFASPVIAAIVSRTGRDISVFSMQPSELEVVLPPDVALLEIARTSTDDGRAVVVIEQLAEIDPQSDLPPTLEALVAEVNRILRDAAAAPPVEIRLPGKFVEQLLFAD